MPQQKTGGWGGVYCKGISTGGEWSKEGKHFPINVVELLVLKFAILTFTKNLSHLTIHVQVDHKVAISSDHNYCRVFSNQVECQSRLGVQQCNRLIRLETSSETLSENNQTLRNTSSRSICLLAVSITFPIYGMEARPKQFCNRCNAAGLGQNVWFCIPTLQLDISGDKQGSSEKCRSKILVTPTSQTQHWNTFLLQMFIQPPLLLPVILNLLLNPLEEKHPLAKTRFLMLAAWKITRKPWKSKEF